jgi:hypothetical protein
MGRFTLPELFGVPTGGVVAGVIIGALGLFWLVEKVEVWMGGAAPQKEQRLYKLAGAAALTAIALGVMFIGQPTPADKWQQMAGARQPLLDNREVYIHPVELLQYIYNDRVDTVMLDVRNESDYNLFHIDNARLVSPDDLPALARELMQQPANTLFVVIGNNEAAATEAWKILVTESVPNLYILEGGVNNWLDTFNVASTEAAGVEVAMIPTPIPTANLESRSDALRYQFPAALGRQYPAANPEPHEFEEVVFIPKVKLEMKQASGGG